MVSGAGTCFCCIATPASYLSYILHMEDRLLGAKNISRLAYGHPRISSYLGMSLMYLERPLAAQIWLLLMEKGLKIHQIATVLNTGIITIFPSHYHKWLSMYI